ELLLKLQDIVLNSADSMYKNDIISNKQTNTTDGLNIVSQQGNELLASIITHVMTLSNYELWFLLTSRGLYPFEDNYSDYTKNNNDGKNEKTNHSDNGVNNSNVNSSENSNQLTDAWI